MDPINENTETSQADVCASAMNKVVEMRKRYGKVCIEYKNKIMNKQLDILKTEIEQMQKIQPKPKVMITPDESALFEAEYQQFLLEDKEYSCRLTRMKNKVENLQEIASQIRRDKINPLLKIPISGENLIAKAKSEEDKDSL